MRKQMILAHLMAMRSAIDALVLELTEESEEQPLACCTAPQVKTEQTYSGTQSYCANCGTVIKAGSDKVSGVVGQPD